jgi:hypothetical protein
VDHGKGNYGGNPCPRRTGRKVMNHTELKELLIKLGSIYMKQSDYESSCIVKDAATEIAEMMDIIEKQQVIIRRIYAEQLPDTWFVCGELGEKDHNNLPKYIEVCPAYGVDWSQLYERTDRTIPGMGG